MSVVSFDAGAAAEYARALTRALPGTAVLVVARDGTVRVAEGRPLVHYGAPASILVGRRLDQVVPGMSLKRLQRRYALAFAGREQQFEYETVSGATCTVRLSPLHAGGREAVAVLVVIEDLTERRRLDSQLCAERDRRLMAEDVAQLGHWEVDVTTTTVDLSPGARHLLARPLAEAVPLDEVLDQVAEEDRAAVREALGVMSREGVAECECGLRAKDGTVRRVLMRGRREPDALGRELIRGVTIDITRLHAAEQGRSRSEALFRQGFDNSPIGMALVDPRTRRYLQVNDAICRLMGRSREDLLELTSLDITLPRDIGGDAGGIEAMLGGSAPSFEVEKRYVKPDGEIVWALLHVVPVRADNGEVEAFFAQVVDVTARKERELALIQEAAELEQLSAIRAALREDRLVLHAQPIVALGSGDVVQQELLVRLRQPDGEILPPAAFLPIAERHGCIQEIDRWVTERAIELAAAGHPVEVNLSAASVGDAELLATIRAALARTGADPSLLVFEVTETALMADVERGREFAAALREVGCRFALDDFGTGYGTFTYLKHIPIDYVKIDVEFVRDLCRNAADQQLVGAIVTMAGGLGKQTIAEGVEDGATLERLRELGVDHAQGYFIGRPRPVGER